ncbi:Uncharacterized conserved protein [Dermatophilus congolensis]|uniref:Uncharacterized conserved protein n=1 Tax=Dermatophilus congolensis TaxID=1863 RepID=A0AA46BPY0_9MICO|nr:threonine/serine exporter family protein [Dermatophilus congolensis]STD14291.1 Uncharacterized conserved protein [Dermatophilus congolensis]
MQPPAPLADTELRRLLTYLAAAAVAGGQPVHEVEADIRRLATRLGHTGVQVTASPTGIILSLGGGTPATFETVEGTLRLDQSADVHDIRAGLMRGDLTPTDALERLSRLRAMPHRYGFGEFNGGMLCVGAGIALILQPAWPSILFAVLAGQVTATLMRASRGRAALGAMLPFLVAFLVAVGAFGAAMAGLIDNPIRSLLPPIAVLLPGALITTGISELASGAMTAGTSRLVFGAGQLLLFSLGIAGAAWILRIPPSLLDTSTRGDLGLWAPFVGVLLLTVGISAMESVPPRLIGWIAFMLTITLTAQMIGQNLSGAPWFGALLGAMVASFGAAIIELYRPQLPRLVIFLPAFWLLVPGSLGLVSVAQLGLAPATAGATLLMSAEIFSSIALGIMLGSTAARGITIAQRRRHAAKRRRSAQTS